MGVLVETSRRERLGQLVALRRDALHLSKEAAARAAGVSPITWGRIEEGDTVRTDSAARVEAALKWPPGTIRRFLAGEGVEPPVEVVVETQQTGDSLTVFARTDALSADERAIVQDLIDSIVRRKQG